MITELSINDHAGTVVSRINAAIEEQNKGVTPLGADPNAGTVISRVNAAIDAENNDQLEEITNSDNAADFIRKVNALFSSINAGGGDEPPTPPEPIVPDYDYWSEKSYIAFGDSITHVDDSWSGGPYLNQRYCYLAAQELGMTLTNNGVSGSMMLYNGKYEYPIGKDLNNNGVFDIYDSGVETNQRSFAEELLNPDSITIVDPNVTQVADHRGPYGVNLQQYDLISLMFGGNDINQIYTYINHPNQQPHFAEIGTSESRNLDSFYGAYYRTVDYITRNKGDAVFVIGIEPKFTTAYFNRSGELVDIIKSIASEFGVPIVDFYNMPLFDSYGQPTGESYNNGTIELKRDGVHPNEEGQRVMADYFKLRLGQIAAELHLSDN